VLTTAHCKSYDVVRFLLGNSRRLNFICRRFGTLCLFHLHRQVGVELRCSYISHSTSDLDDAISARGQVTGCCECGYEPSGSINNWEFLDCLEYRLASREELCYMGLLSVVS